MTVWEALKQHALLGQQQPLAGILAEHSATLEPELANALAKVQTLPIEQQVLHAVALLGQYRQAGRQFPRSPRDRQTDMPICHSETRPVCADQCQTWLHAWLLDTAAEDLLLECLTLIEQHGQRVPYGLLVPLLNRAKQNPAFRKQLPATVLGERGQWLSQLNSDWHTLWQTDSVDDETLLRTGPTDLREQALGRLRRHDPAHALSLLQALWPQEDAKTRIGLLIQLHHGLHAGDAEFLRHCQQDRSQAIRAEATRQLVLLDDPIIIDTLSEQLLVFFQLRQHPPPTRLNIQLPGQFDKTWSRFGIKEKPPRGGKKAFWLSQWLQLLPPSQLLARLGGDWETIAEVLHSHTFRDTVLAAWDNAAVAYQDDTYINWRLQHCANRDFVHLFPALAPGLAFSQRIDRLANFLHRALPQMPALSLWELSELVAPCSPMPANLSEQLIRHCLPALKKHHSDGDSARQVAARLAANLAPELFPLLDRLDLQVPAALYDAYQLRFQLQQVFVSSPENY